MPYLLHLKLVTQFLFMILFSKDYFLTLSQSTTKTNFLSSSFFLIACSLLSTFPRYSHYSYTVHFKIASLKCITHFLKTCFFFFLVYNRLLVSMDSNNFRFRVKLTPDVSILSVNDLFSCHHARSNTVSQCSGSISNPEVISSI